MCRSGPHSSRRYRDPPEQEKHRRRKDAADENPFNHGRSDVRYKWNTPIMGQRSKKDGYSSQPTFPMIRLRRALTGGSAAPASATAVMTRRVGYPRSRGCAQGVTACGRKGCAEAVSRGASWPARSSAMAPFHGGSIPTSRVLSVGAAGQRALPRSRPYISSGSGVVALRRGRIG